MSRPSLASGLIEESSPEPTRLPRLWSVRSLAERWQISRRQIYRFHEDGKLPGVRVMGVLRFREEDLMRLLEEEKA